MLRRKVFEMTHSTVPGSTQLQYHWVKTRASNKIQFILVRCFWVSITFVNVPVDLRYTV